jgi:hypothetical protein
MADPPPNSDALKMARVKQAVATVLSDYERTTTRTTNVTVSSHTFDDSAPFEILIAVDGNWSTGEYDTDLEDEELVASIADYLQGEWIERTPYNVWPMCERHGVGTHAKVHGEVAVWWCRVGRHHLARIGNLGISA